MYDAILISPHYDYHRHDGQAIPNPDDPDKQNLSMIIPLGILHLAQHLYDIGYNIRVVHLPHEYSALQRVGIDIRQIDNPVESILKNYPARVCGIQTHFYLYCGGAVRVAEIYKELFPDSTVLLGGYMATAFWKEFLGASSAIDGIVLGEGERTLHHILERSTTPLNCELHTVEGLACRKTNGDFNYHPNQARNLLDIDEMPVIDPDAPPFTNLLWPKRTYMNLSRGLCPEPCAYCVGNNRSINPRSFQTIRIDRILKQLAIYGQKGFQGVFFGENHFLDMAFMHDLLDAIIRSNFDLYFELETHPVIFTDRRLLTKMIEAGFLRYTMGCESGADFLLKRIGRRSSARQIMESVKQISGAGGLVVTSWICNLPGETESDFQATQKLLRDVVTAGGFNYWIENLHVLPGSRFYEQPDRWGIEVLLKNLKDWTRWARVSKVYVDPKEAELAPTEYLTHLHRNTSPKKMIKRFFAQRRLARDLIPAMQENLSDRADLLPQDLAQSERQRHLWYEEKGWRLLLF